MPALVRFLVTHALIGIALAAAFVGVLVALDVARLGTLVSTSPDGILAVALLTAGLAVTFGSVQMGFAVMLMNGRDDTTGGSRVRIRRLILLPVKASAGRR
ncbi:hypothetical protein ACT6QG_05825 [Xanthobacter sp. TB0136]|uniref:hypothetical protein n=1 Tax=Xanthobacter sp. TB0136 TaxID=3459177 RepID=UPI0040394032